MLKKISWIAILFVTLPLIAPAALADEHPTPIWELDQFGFQERLTFRSNQSSTNFSPLLNWAPKYNFKGALEDWRVGLDLGIAYMRGNTTNFPAFQYAATVDNFHFSENLYPELLVGAETWSVTNGGTYFLLGGELHWDPNFSLPVLNRILNFYAGYHAFWSSPFSNQVVLGFQFKI